MSDQEMPEDLGTFYEALLFIAERPLSSTELGELAGVPRLQAEAALASLAEQLKEDERGIRLQRHDDAWQLATAPEVGARLAAYAAREEQLIDENLVSLGRRSALERTAYMLLHLFTRAGEAGLVKGNAIQFPFTQQHVADTLGMSLVHTNKTIKRLMASNAVRWKDRVFEVIDRAALVRIAGEDVTQRRPRPFI